MSESDDRFWGALIRDLEELAGPLRSVPGPMSAFEVLEGTYRGLPVRATWLGRLKSGSTTGSVLHLSASLGDRPIRTYVWRRKGSSVFGPKATTGDRDFDEMYIASARPPEVVSEALDADVRQMIRRRWPDTDTSLNAADGWVSLIAGRSDPGPSGARTLPNAEEVASMLDDMVLAAERLTAAYDRRLAALQANEGPPRPPHGSRPPSADLTKQRRTGRAIAAVVVITFVVIVAVIIGLTMG